MINYSKDVAKEKMKRQLTISRYKQTLLHKTFTKEKMFQIIFNKILINMFLVKRYTKLHI